MYAILLWLLLAGTAQATEVWYWDAIDPILPLPPTVTLECSPVVTGPFTVVATIPSVPQQISATPPASWTTVFCRLNSLSGVSNVAGGAVTPAPVVVDPRMLALETKLAGICRAAKAMGGTSTSFAGRLRKEIPCL